jgi:hypothetical protein
MRGAPLTADAEAEAEADADAGVAWVVPSGRIEVPPAAPSTWYQTPSKKGCASAWEAVRRRLGS